MTQLTIRIKDPPNKIYAKIKLFSKLNYYFLKNCHTISYTNIRLVFDIISKQHNSHHMLSQGEKTFATGHARTKVKEDNERNIAYKA